MPQHDYNIANAAGATVRADINNALLAVAQQNSGATGPVPSFPFQTWFDESVGVLNIRDSGNNNWIPIGKLDGSGWTPIRQGVLAGTAIEGDKLALLPPGAGAPFFGTVAPEGFLLCDGSNVSRTTFAALFAAIGISWGAGDGSTTFTLPDARRRVMMGSGGTAISGPGNAVGSYGGAETHALTGAQTGPHLHAAGTLTVLVGNDTGSGTLVAERSNTVTNQFEQIVGGSTASGGSGAAHNNVQPSMVVLAIIKT